MPFYVCPDDLDRAEYPELLSSPEGVVVLLLSLLLWAALRLTRRGP